MTSADATSNQLTMLSDDQAIRVLKIFVEHNRLSVPVDDWDSARGHIHEAVKAAGLDTYTPSVGIPCSDGDLARVTLQYLAESDDHALDVIGQAIVYVREPGERFDPITLTLGALVLTALQTDLKLKRDGKGTWTFELHKMPMQDTTLAKVITAFINRFTNGGS